MIEKLIFLDIDGVLNSAQSAEMYCYVLKKEFQMRDSFCPNSIAMLYKILREHPECKIVISSTWRLGYTDDNVNEIFDSIQSTDIKEAIKSRVIGRTPCFRDRITVGLEVESRSHFRGEEIQAWIDQNKAKLSKDLRFVILDDESDMSYLYNYLVQTDGYVGLTYQNALEVIAKLKTRDERKRSQILEAVRQIKCAAYTLANESDINRLAEEIRNLLK